MRRYAAQAESRTYCTRKLAQLENEIADKQNRTAREEQIRRVQKLRDNRRKMPAAWRMRKPIRTGGAWRDTTNIDRRSERKSTPFCRRIVGD